MGHGLSSWTPGNALVTMAPIGFACWRSWRQCAVRPRTALRRVVVAFVITQPCIDTTDQSCVEVCPVDCIHPTKNEPEFAKATIISGKLVFRRERWYHGILHNETPAAIQRRLQWLGVPMVVLPVRASV